MHLKARYNSLGLFKKDLYSYKSLDDFYYKLLTIISLVLRDRRQNCFCEEYEKFSKGRLFVCPFCYVPMLFYKPKEELRENRLNVDFLLLF